MTFSFFSPARPLPFVESEPPPPSGTQKFFPGHYWKIFTGNVLITSGANAGNVNTSALNTIFNEIQASPACRGVKFVIDWGTTERYWNQNKWYRAVIDDIARRCWEARSWAINPRPLRFMMAINVKGSKDINDLLPPDLIVPTTVPNQKTGYTPYTLAYPYNVAGAGPDVGGINNFSGYYPKLWKNIVQTRLLQFFQTIANYVPPIGDGKSLDQGDLLAMFSSLESAPRNSWNGYQDSTTTDGDPVGSLGAYEDGWFEMNKRIKQAFPKTPVTISLNYSRPLCAEIIPQLHALKIGINTPNINFSKGINTVDTPDPNTFAGILQYFEDPTIYNSLIINPEVQGDDFVSTYGKDARDRADAFAKQNPPDWNSVDAEYDFPSYQSLFNRFKALNTHYAIWQRELPFWNGGTLTEQFTMWDDTKQNHTFPGTRPPFLATFFKTNAELNNPNDPAGGLNSVQPTNAL